MGRRVLAAAGLLSVVVTVPLVLLEFAGSPSIDRLPDLEGIRTAIELQWVPVEWAMQVLALFAWALWAYLLLTLLLRVAGSLQARRGTEGRLWAASEALTWSPVKVLVDFALGAILLNSAASPSPARAGEPGWARAVTPQIAVVREDQAPLPKESSKQPVKDQSNYQTDTTHARGVERRAKSANASYVVRPGDSLWSIAEAKLEDPYRWREIWRLNQGRSMSDGERLVRPGFIRPGWTLRLPDDGGKENKAARERARAAAEHERCDDDRLKDRSGKHPSAARARNADSSEPPPTESPSPVPSEASDSSTQRIELPSGTAVAAAFIAGLATAAAAAQLRARRRRVPGPAPRGWPKPTSQQNLKSRLERALSQSGEDGETEGLAQPIEIEGPSAQEGPSAILLGHRGGKPVHARPQEDMLTLAGRKEEVQNLSSGPWRPQPRFLLMLALVPRLEGERPERAFAIAAQGRSLGLVVCLYATGTDALELREGELHPTGSMEKRFGPEPIQTLRLATNDRDEALSRLRTDAAPSMDDEMEAEERVSAPAQLTRGQARITVRLFRPPYFGVGEREIKEELQPKSRETLTFFLLRPEGASREQAAEALWPEADPRLGAQRVGRQLRRIRIVLRTASGTDEKFIALSGEIYRLQPELFDVDVWEFDRLLDEANHNSDRAGELLRRATDLYRGALLEGAYYDWAEPLRSHFQRRFVDAMVPLSDVYSGEGRKEDAAGVLEKTITVEPFGEYIYRRAMILYADLGRGNEIRRVYRRLEAALAQDLDTEPEEETVQLRSRLLEDLSHRSPA